MRKWRNAFLALAVLTTVWAISATFIKPAPKPVPAGVAQLETATLAGGCFWGLQETLRVLPGVIHTSVGYAGGTTPDPTFEQVAGGKTGHLEAAQVLFDPARLSYERLLTDFLSARVPARLATSPDQSHRPVIFYHDAGQRQAAELVLVKMNRSGTWKVPLLAEIHPAAHFYPAEEYHQDYYRKSVAVRTCGLE